MANKTLYTDPTIVKRLSVIPPDYAMKRVAECDRLLAPQDKKRLVMSMRYILKEIVPGDFSPMQKVYLLHEMIVRTVTYSKTQDIYYRFIGPLLYRKGVCEGISEFLMIMCELCGVNARTIVGGTGKSIGEIKRSKTLHAWNIVYLDAGGASGKQWYHMDATWDINDRGLTYFLKSDRYMQQHEHLWLYDKDYKEYTCPADAVITTPPVSEREVREACEKFKRMAGSIHIK